MERSKLKHNYKPLKQFLDTMDEDMQSAWNYVPFDQPGHFLQSIRRPETSHEFIVVQPFCAKNMSQDTKEQRGKLKLKQKTIREDEASEMIEKGLGKLMSDEVNLASMTPRHVQV